jgi:DNA-binding transcriptional LysR family regulator
MRLRHIEVFHAVYTCGSMTAAARLLRVSQPSVSKVLAHAEQQLGYPLFDRVKGKLIPTREADRLIGLVSGVYQSIDELRRVADNLASSDTGRIRIASTPAFGIDLVPGAVAGYLGLHPETRFEVETLHFSQVARALNQSRIDLGLVFQPSDVPGLVAEELAPAEFVLVAPRGQGFDEDRRIRLEEIEGRPFIGLSNRGPLGRLLTKKLTESGARFHSSISAETYQMALALVAHGTGVAIVDEITARSVQMEKLSLMRIDPPLHFNIALMHAEAEPPSVLTQRFVAHLRAHIRGFLCQDIKYGV